MVFRKNRKMAKPYTSALNAFVNGMGPQKLSSRSNESSICADPFHEKKRSMHLYKVSPFCDFCETQLVYGGVRVARNAAHST